jgi:L-2-hydroxyglutarate oxidase
MSSKKYDIAIIGGGIVGLATAMTLCEWFPQYQIVVLDKEGKVATHQTGHNSGVIHSGLYYRPGSQKARFCVDGAHALKAFCEENEIPHKLTGKVVVATNNDELVGLHNLYNRGVKNGVEGLKIIGPDELKEFEPQTKGLLAIHCPTTGIVDYTAIAAVYASRMQLGGVHLLVNSKVLRISRREGSLTLETTGGDLEVKYLINCAGLQADIIARKMGVEPDLQIIPFRGEYYTLVPEASHLVNGLVYPVPNPQFPFLGVHFTRLLNGGIEAGPNAVLALDREGYRRRDINVPHLMKILAYRGFWAMATRYWKAGLGEVRRSFSKSAFTRELQKLIPEIRKEDLVPKISGVRAQAVDTKGNLLDDFRIVESQQAIHVFNAPSPAATCSLAIGKHITELARKSFELVTKS